MNETVFGMSYLSGAIFPKVVAVLLGVVVFNLAGRFVLHRLESATRRTKNLWDDALVQAMRQPLFILAWVVGLAYAAELIHQDKSYFFHGLVAPVRDTAIIACIAWFLFKLIHNIADKLLVLHEQDEERVDRTTIDALSKLSRFAVIVLASVMVMHVLGFSVSGVLAFGGLSGIVAGFAAKDLLANLFGGLMIYMDRPFVVGESIRSPDKEIEGVVEHIDWRLTRIRSLNKSVFYIPNSLFTSIIVENISRTTQRRIKETLGLRYEDIAMVEKIVAEIREMLVAHAAIDKAEFLSVNLDQYADSALNLTLIAFTHTPDLLEYKAIKQDILLKAADIISKHGAGMAFPTRTLHIASNANTL